MPQTPVPHEVRNWMPAYVVAIEVATTFLLIIRMLSRVWRDGCQLGLDDFFIVIAWLLGVPITVIVLLGVFNVSTVFRKLTNCC
jgi:hypothetical protein